MDHQHLVEQAARCRRLAANTLDQNLRDDLLKLAAEYQQTADELAGGSDGQGRENGG
jgi:hypothetical protein